MAGRKIYDNNPYYNYDINAFRKAAMQDPKFALGEIIGGALANAYANNYNNRGIEKAVDKALQSFGTGDAANEQAALQDLQQNYAQQPGVSVGDMDALNSIRQENGLSALQPSGPAISVGTIPQTETPEQAIARIAQTPGAAIVAREQAARKLGNFDMNTALMQARQQMLKDGRTPYQVEQAMQQLQPYFQNMQDEEYRINAERIMSELGATDENGKRILSDNDYKQKIIELSQLGDIGKAAANVYGRDIVTGREQWNAQQQEAKENRMLNRQIAQEDRRFNRQLAIADRNNSVRMAIAQARGAGKNKTAGTGGVSKEDATWADKQIKDLEEKLATLRMEDPKANLSQTDIQIYNQAAAIRDLANQQRANRYNLGGNTQQQSAGTGKYESTGREFNRNDYNDQARALLGMIRANKGVLDDNLAAKFREIIGLDPNNTNPDEMTNQVIYDLRAYRKDAGKDTSGHGGKSGLF